MKVFSNSQAAKRLGISAMSLGRYIEAGKLTRPKMLREGSAGLYVWTEEEIERARNLLPKIANGRKTRYQKLREQHKAPAGVPVPHRKKRSKKKK